MVLLTMIAYENKYMCIMFNADEVTKDDEYFYQAVVLIFCFVPLHNVSIKFEINNWKKKKKKIS